MIQRALLTLIAALGLTGAADAQIALGHRTAPPPPYYLGAVATHTTVNGNLNTADTTAMSRSPHFARDNITSLQVVLSNFYVYTGFSAEAGPGNAASVTASIEYPAGTCNQLKFSGSTTGSIPNDSTLITDSLSVTIPKDALFWVRIWTSSAGGMPYDQDGGQKDTQDGEQMAVGTTASPVADATACQTITDNYGYSRKPLAIIGLTQRPTVCLIGDSFLHGAMDSTTTTRHDNGILAPSVGPTFAYLNLAADGDQSSAVTLSTHWSNRGRMLQYCTHVIWEYGNNDIDNSVTPATVLSNFATLRAAWPNATLYPNSPCCQWWMTTLSPVVTTTDSLKTVANQTPYNGSGTARTTYNDGLRASLPSGVAGYIEVAGTGTQASPPNHKQTMSSLDSNAWTVYGDGVTANWMSGDALHLNTAGANWMQGFINPRALFCTDAASRRRC